MRIRFVLAAAIATAAAMAAAPASALQVTLTPVRDSTVFQDNADYSGGASPVLFVGNTAGGSARRALIEFDLSQIPAGSEIESVSLRIMVDRNGTGSSPADLALLHRLTADWGEGSADAGTGGGGTQASPDDATWAYRFYGSPPAVPRIDWTSAGGDFVATASGQTALSSLGMISFASTAGLVGDVQRWLDDPFSNFGWIMIGDESRDQNARRFFSRSALGVGDRPLLTIDYTAPIPEPSTYVMLLAGLGLLGFLARRRGH